MNVDGEIENLLRFLQIALISKIYVAIATSFSGKMQFYSNQLFQSQYKVFALSSSAAERLLLTEILCEVR